MFRLVRWPHEGLPPSAVVGGLGPAVPPRPVPESFFHALKVEFVHQRQCGSHEEAKRDLFKYIEEYYNPHRIHSALGYLSQTGPDYRQVIHALQS
jgi:Integrase core domain